MRESALRLAAAVAVAAAVTGVTVAGAFEQPRFNPAAPGLDSVSAMRTLPAFDASPALRAAVTEAAHAAGGDAAAAVATLRQLRGNLGRRDDVLVAFAPALNSSGRPLCVILWRRSGSCPTIIHERHPGFDWQVSGSYWTDIGGKRVVVPTAVFGVVSDDVRAVDLVVGERSTRLELVNNSYYAEIDDPAPGAPWKVSLRATYRDGSAISVDLPDGRPA